ncbi:MAG: cob(I)yrinic acid a,c-diamide adenosyltransferase [Candidatus Uhrbacteria bacterium]|nr:cob(I)yrinic acid a,c-diamide adenosyltransferase [Candidatus Uhrbacteria bacterium]
MQKMYVANKAFLVNPQGKILFLRETGFRDDHEFSKGRWHVPGGRMDAGELPLHGLLREIKEETGLEIEPSKPKLLFADTWTIPGDRDQTRITGLYYVIEVTADVNIELSEEHDALRWVDPRVDFSEDMIGADIEIDYYRKYAKILRPDVRVKGFDGYGLVQLYYGSGKGKSTSALGQAVRCAGAGKRVAIIYFDKGGDSHYSERLMLDQIENIDYWATGRDRIDAKSGRFDFSIVDTDKLEAVRGLELAREALTCGNYDLVVLDELSPTIDLGMLDLQRALKVIDEKHPTVELIITGRNPHEEIKSRAHLITEMKLEGHYFYSGVKAREGLDY